jgi:hypothetical protein
MKPPRRDAWALSPAGMFEGKKPLRLAAQKSRPHAPLAPMRSTPAYLFANGEYKLQGGLVPSKISGVGTNFELLFTSAYTSGAE